MEKIDDAPADSFYYHEMDPSSQWTYFEDCDGMITKIYDKKEEVPSEVRKLFVGVFRIKYAEDFKKCLEKAFENENEEISSFYFALKLYTKRHPMQPVYTDNWFDIGHADRYFSSQLEVRAREFNHITVDRNRGILRKTSDNKEKFIGEILWYLKLPLDVEYVRPRIFGYSVSYDDPYIEMEYYSYHTLSELYLYGDLKRNQWKDIFKRIRFICDDFSRYKVSGETDVLEAQRQIYLEKTLKRLGRMKDQKFFAPFFFRNFAINGQKYISLERIMDKLKSAVPEILYENIPFCIIHGDLCFSNIMVDSDYSFIKVIDPRGSFGKYDIYGDPRYEIAKLFHSIEGKYDFIVKDLFHIEVDETEISIRYEIDDGNKSYDLMDVFKSIFEGYIAGREKEIRFIEALLFLSMLPLHNESVQHQFALFATGIELLDKVLDIRDDRMLKEG